MTIARAPAGLPSSVKPSTPWLTDTRIVKLVVLVNGAVPLAMLLWDYFHHGLGADPAQYALLTTGLLAIIFIMLTLTITPLRRITGWNTLIAARRLLGLYAFFYACVHISIYFINDVGMSVPTFISEVRNRFYLLIGITALLLMVPLALTSTNGMIRRLGAARWNLLHRAIYFTAILAVIHYCLQSKVVSPQQIGFIIALLVLLGYRVVAKLIDLPSPRLRLHAFPVDVASGQAARAMPGAVKKKFWKGEMEVARIFDETPQVRTFRLVVPGGGELPFDYLPGQYLTMSLRINGAMVHRSFTIASSPTRGGGGFIEITVKREPAGTATKHLHDAVRVGDRVHISAPAGRFTFIGREADSLVLLAGGVGITPLMSVIRYLTDKSWHGRIFLAYTARTPADIIFREELDALAQRFANLHVRYTLTQAPSEWHGDRGRLTAEYLQEKIPDLRRSRIHICGPQQMIEDLRTSLAALGIAEREIQSESFVRAAGDAMEPGGDVAEMPPADGISGATVTFARSGKSGVAGSDETILELAERVGVPLDFDCRSGICGTCKRRLLSGEVQMDVQEALTAGEKARQIILACQAKPLTDVTVDA